LTDEGARQAEAEVMLKLGQYILHVGRVLEASCHCPADRDPGRDDVHRDSGANGVRECCFSAPAVAEQIQVGR
jgi:hypothetical protein